VSVVDVMSYTVTLIAIALAPGPVALILIVKSASNDLKGALAFGVGFAFGGMLITAIVCLGINTWMSSFPEAFAYTKYIMMAYMIFLAWQIWNTGFELAGASTQKCNSNVYSFCTGLITCFLSPYMMLLFPLVLPSLVDMVLITPTTFLLIWLLTFLALFGGSVLLIVFSAQIRHLVNSQRSMTLLRGSLSFALVFGGGWMALS